MKDLDNFKKKHECMDKRKLAFGRMNFILIAAGMAAVVAGFLLMAGPSSSPEMYEPDIFSVRRVKVAPLVCLLGFLFMIYGVVKKPSDTNARD